MPTADGEASLAGVAAGAAPMGGAPQPYRCCVACTARPLDSMLLARARARLLSHAHTADASCCSSSLRAWLSLGWPRRAGTAPAP